MLKRQALGSGASSLKRRVIDIHRPEPEVEMEWTVAPAAEERKTLDSMSKQTS
jgi:hypothetical protein